MFVRELSSKSRVQCMPAWQPTWQGRHRGQMNKELAMLQAEGGQPLC